MPTLITILAAAVVFALLLTAAGIAVYGRWKVDADADQHQADDDFTRAIHDFGSIRREWDRNA